MKNAQSVRLYFVDWLRVLAMIGIFFFHNARFYDVFTDWQVKNSSTSMGPSLLVGFMNEWLMPLFFLVAGAGVFLSLKFRQHGQFIRERSLRLLVPLFFGMVVIVAPQAYFEAVNHGTDLGGYNFLQLYGMHLQNLLALPWYHLWFLAYLFAFSLATLPLFWALKHAGKNITEGFLSRPWIVLPLVLLCLASADTLLALDGFWGNRIQGNWSIVAYLLFFISGYLIFTDERVMITVKKLRWVWLVIATAALACGVTVFLDVHIDRAAYFGSGIFTAAEIVQAFSTWGWLLAILGLGSHYLERNNRFLAYANEAVLPFYVLHQTIIISIGFYVVQWSAGIGLKYLVISATSFVAIMLIYELLVRRINILRFLFGMRLRRKLLEPGKPRIIEPATA